MTDTPETDLFQVIDAIAPTVQVGRKTFEAGRIVQGFMFFCAPDLYDPIAPRLAKAAQHALQVVPPHSYEFWAAQEPYRPTAIADIMLPDPQSLLREYEDNLANGTGRNFHAKLWTGRKDGKAPPRHLMSFYHDSFYETPAYANSETASCFQLNLPLPWLSEHFAPGDVQRLFAELCAILRPRSAYGGLVMATPLALSVLQEQAHNLKPLFDTHPGLMVGQAFDMHYTMRNRMSAPNWLTALDERLLSLCGGAEAIQEQLKDCDCQTKQADWGGLLIQAGPSPQLGNLEEGVRLPHYGAVARALKPARVVISGRGPHVKDYGSEDADYALELRIEEQNAWLSRFDTH